jgi:uncharacterized protein YndB with AHSA1/START domain
MNRVFFSLLLLLLPLAVPAAAEVLDSSAHGFTSQNAATVAAPPATVYTALVQDVSSWWSSDHTISGSAENLRIDAQQGGCFCEVLPGGGSIRHLTVVQANPGKLLRLTGGLGPLQAEGVSGSLTWALEEDDDGTNLIVTYSVGGFVTGGLDSWSAGVDRVVGEQLTRLARYIETGDPETAANESDR